MPQLAENTKAWLKDLAAEGSLSDEELKSLEETLGKNEKVAKRLEESVLRQNDYDRAFNKRKQEFEEKEQKALQLQQELADWKKGADEKITSVTAEVESERKARQEQLDSIKAKAQELGLDPADLGITGDPKPAPKKEDTPPTGDYIKKDDVQKLMSDVVMLPALMQDISAQHHQLFNEPLARASDLVRLAAEQKKSIQDVWESEFKVADRRKAIEEEATKKREEEIRADERQKVLSDVQMPVRSEDPSSPVLTKFAPSPQKKEELSGAEAAVLAHREGKYRQVETP